MLRSCRHWLALCVVLLLLAACGGGGDSTTTSLSGPGINNMGMSPPVALPFTQTTNNLRVIVEDGPHSFQLSANANVLYATVVVCSPVDTSQCVSIDHVQVDTGSVGLRVLASKVKALNLPPLALASGTLNARECFPFVIGGLWGANALAVVGLGQQQTSPLAIQLIEDDTNAATAMQATDDCIAAANGKVLSSAASLGSNGILGIGSTNIDCGQNCVLGDYTGTFVQYYACTPGTVNAASCTTNTPVPPNFQVSNPVFHLPVDNNGVILAMPSVSYPGAGSASGELIFGIGTQGNNQVPTGLRRVFLGVDSSSATFDAYLNISTQFGGTLYRSSYLDTGTNGLFFDSAASNIRRCAGDAWYCPQSNLSLTAKLWDGGVPELDAVTVPFQIGNAEALFSTSNTAFSDAAGVAPSGSTSFAWGMPFFYGKRVYMSIWDITVPLTLPLADPQTNPAWYAWQAL